jgi:hypothetical protein
LSAPLFLDAGLNKILLTLTIVVLFDKLLAISM